MNVIDEAVEAVICMMNGISPFATVTRGALPTGIGITCEVTSTMMSEYYLNKGARIPIDITLNGKHYDLQVLSDDLNGIHDMLTRIIDPTLYPSGTNWKIIDIVTNVYPHIISREVNNEWIMASSLIVNLGKKGV